MNISNKGVSFVALVADLLSMESFHRATNGCLFVEGDVTVLVDKKEFDITSFAVGSIITYFGLDYRLCFLADSYFLVEV